VFGLKVLHIENPAGVATSLCDAQRKIGIDSEVLITWPNKLSFRVDHDIHFEGFSISTAKAMRRVVGIAKKCDVLHVHSGINWKRADLIWLGAIVRKPMVVHYHGSETRMGYGSYFSSLAGRKIVSTPDLLEWWPNAEYIPNPADELLIERPFVPPNDLIRIVHLPTDRKIKGTDNVLKAIDILKGEGLKFEFQLLEGIPHSDAMAELYKADIVIDWLSDRKITGVPGIYGKTSIEAMALGKAAVAYIEPSVRHNYPDDMPVLSPDAPTPRSLADSVRHLLLDRTLLEGTMRAGKSYASKVHGPDEIAKRFQKIYEDIS
jgi:glycosyltransferase involved in cell wall biosynthesis